MKNFNCSSPNYLKKSFLKNIKQKTNNNHIVKYAVFKCHLSRSKKNTLLESKISNSHNQMILKNSTKTAKVSPVSIHKKIIKNMNINSNSNAISSIINIDPRYYINKNISESKSKSISKSISKSKSKSKSKDNKSNKIGKKNNNLIYSGKFKNNNINNVKKINYIFSHGHINKKIIKNQISCLNKSKCSKKINIKINKFPHIHRRHHLMHKINFLSNNKTNLIGIGYSNNNIYLNHIINKINSNNFKTTPSSGLNSTKSSKEKNKTKINISNNSNSKNKIKNSNMINNNYNNNLLISKQLKIHMDKKKYNSMNKIKNILITNETNNNINQNNISSLINKNSIIPHLNKNISNLNNNIAVSNYNFDQMSHLSKSFITNYKKKFFKTKTDMKIQNDKYMKKMIKNYYDSINHNNISHNIYSIQKMSKTNTKFINHYKNYNFNKNNINKGKNIYNNNNNIKRKNKSKNNSSILYSKLINNNFSYSTNSKNSKSHSNKKNKKQNNFNESLIKKGITGNNTKIRNKIGKEYNNLKKNFNKNNICFQKGKKITKKKITNIINNNNKSVLLTKREKTSLVQSESINNNKTSNKYDNIDKKSKRKYKQNNLISNYDSNKDKKISKNIDMINNINENNNIDNLSISILPNENYYLEESKKLSDIIVQYGREHKYKIYPKTNLSYYKIGRCVGRGAFGKVNIALHVLSGHIVAIKSFNKTNHNFPLNKIKYEIKIMQKLRNNKKIVKLLEAFENEKYFFIIMENIIGGNLLNAINKMNKLSESISRNIFKQLIETIKYIHSKGIVHRDIKPDNILLNINNNIKLCDFGVSKEIKKGQLITDSCGTPAFIAPEILLDEPYDPYKTDIWSSGVVLYVMVSGFFPFNGINESQLHRHILSGKFPKLQNISNELNDLINKILEINPKKRITIDEILNHPWVKNEENQININENNNKLNNNYDLFTKAEKIIYFKLRRDYRDINYNEEGNLETFTYRNIDTNYQDENLNNLTMSFVHTPFNSRRERDYDDDLYYDDVNIEKDIMKFLPKANEMNKQYEINNNCDFDHGYIINKKDNKFQKKIMSSFNESYLKKQKNIKNKKDDESKNKENKNDIILNNKNFELDKENGNEYDNKNNKDNKDNKDNFSTKSNTFNFDNNAIKYVEGFGYKREFIIKSLETNEINHATATYYLKLSLNDE